MSLCHIPSPKSVASSLNNGSSLTDGVSLRRLPVSSNSPISRPRADPGSASHEEASLYPTIMNESEGVGYFGIKSLVKELDELIVVVEKITNLEDLVEPQDPSALLEELAKRQQILGEEWLLSDICSGLGLASMGIPSALWEVAPHCGATCGPEWLFVNCHLVSSGFANPLFFLMSGHRITMSQTRGLREPTPLILYPGQGSNKPIPLLAWAKGLPSLTSDIQNLESGEGLLKIIYHFVGQASLRELCMFSFPLRRATEELIALWRSGADLLREERRMLTGRFWRLAIELPLSRRPSEGQGYSLNELERR
ncbi:hypothetical protein AMTR_s00096p00101550 [Amborella trichopoda]|uniref:Uncharacterized protein n=1 Tax=Amborella trichopoda TaxID=13333 RepID=W1P412_AMBTC|nr:hypothetical protein AMTR_s00096p00101550 [Amborella trichopoda]